MQIRLPLLLVFSMLSLLGSIACADDMNLVITLDRADLQHRVERLFPISREDILLSVKLQDPEVILKEGSDRIGLRLRVLAIAGEQVSVSGRARVDGILRFKSSSGEFFLDDASVEELWLDDIAPIYLREIRQLADAVVRQTLQDYPIYTLGQMGENTRLMGSDIKSIKVHDGRLIIELAMP